MGLYPKSQPMSDVEWVKDRRTPNFLGTVKTSYVISFLPRKCKVSKKSLFLRKAYRVRHTHYFRSGDDDSEDRWYHKKEYFKLRLMG